jgi:chemotaxis protein CheD
MLHALLPAANGSKRRGKPTKFVDQGVSLMIEALLERGARRERLVVSLCGGARMLSEDSFNGSLQVGEDNVRAAEAALLAAGVRVQAQETGGRVGRTVRLYVATGQVTVRTLKRGERAIRQRTLSRNTRDTQSPGGQYAQRDDHRRQSLYS